MELTNAVRELLLHTARALKGSARRMFIARAVQALGEGGQRFAEREMAGIVGRSVKECTRWSAGSSAPMPSRCLAASRVEEHLPNLLSDLTAMVDDQSQADPQFRTNRLYTRMSAAEVRRQLIGQKVYTDAELPTAETIATKLNMIGYYAKKVVKTQPQKNRRNRCHLCPGEADQRGGRCREGCVTDLDGCQGYGQGRFLRTWGKSRVPTKAADHAFQPVATVTPVGIFLPASDELFLYGVTSKVTSDCLVGRLVDWWETVKERFAHITTLVINLDNGPENHSRRTQFMQRLVEFVQRYDITIRLAYYPPYPSRVQRS
jgi:Rhodopirellula transposase DDE domain